MKIFSILILTFLLLSCSNSKQDDVGVIKETSQIISDYPDTLESSIKDAKAVTEKQNQNSNDLEKELQKAK